MGLPATGLVGSRIVGDGGDMLEVARWRDLGIGDSEQIDVIRDVMQRKRDGPPARFRYFTAAMQERAALKAQPPLVPAEIHPFPTRKRSDGERLDAHLDALKARLAHERLE